MCEKDHCQRPGDVLVRRLIHEQREKAERRMTPSEAFKRYFGPEHGVELPPPERHGYRPVEFADESKT